MSLPVFYQGLSACHGKGEWSYLGKLSQASVELSWREINIKGNYKLYICIICIFVHLTFSPNRPKPRDNRNANRTAHSAFDHYVPYWNLLAKSILLSQARIPGEQRMF